MLSEMIQRCVFRKAKQRSGATLGKKEQTLTEQGDGLRIGASITCRLMVGLFAIILINRDDGR